MEHVQSAKGGSRERPQGFDEEYEALLELYQAQNALAIAEKRGAERYDPNTYAKAQALLAEAEQLNANKDVDSHRVVDSAREAAQTAEDARMVAERRMHDDQIAKANTQIADAERARLQAAADAERARRETASAQAQVEAERAARERAEADAANARERARQAEAQAQVQVNQANAAATAAVAANTVRQQQTETQEAEHQKSELRMRLMEQLNGAMPTRDTVWGLMSTVPNYNFNGAELRGISADQLKWLVKVVNSHPGLHIVVEGHCDVANNESIATRRAIAVRDALLSSGLYANLVEVRSMGISRPLTSNSTESGREQNRRVEIIVAGDPIGKTPFWNQPYTLTPRQGGQ